MTADRIATLIVIEPSGSAVKTSGLSIEDTWTRYSFTPLSQGNYWTGLATKANKIELSGENFTEYLKHDGLPNVLKEREQKGIGTNLTKAGPIG